MIKCYSPHPQSAYVWRGAKSEYRPVPLDAPHAWNLVWLSIPGVDKLLDPGFDILDYETCLNPRATGSLSALVTISREKIHRIMGRSPIQFVQALQDHLDLPNTTAWKILGGHQWVETMMARASQVDEMADVYAAAKSSSNIVLVNFTSNTEFNIDSGLEEISDESCIEERKSDARLRLAYNHDAQDPKNNSESQAPSEPVIYAEASFHANSINKEMAHADMIEALIPNRDGTVSDPNTGLVWMCCLLGQYIDGYAGSDRCLGAANTYDWENTKLIRHRHAGHEDWRLPTVEELESIFRGGHDKKHVQEIFSWLDFEDHKNGVFSDIAVWTSSIGEVEGVDGPVIYAYYPADNNVADCFGEYLEDHHQVLLVRGAKESSSATSDARDIQQKTESEIIELGDGNGRINDETRASAITLLSDINNTGPGPQNPLDYKNYLGRGDNQKDDTDAYIIHKTSEHNNFAGNNTKCKIGHYVDNSDGTVTDTHTGLMWMRCTLGQIWDGKSCTGEVSRHRFDHASILRLEYANHSDWRLPTIEELESLIDLTHANPTIDTLAFPNTPSSYPHKWFWSSSKNIEAPTYTLRISFGAGEVFSFASYTECWSVRLVRTEQRYYEISKTSKNHTKEITEDSATEVDFADPRITMLMSRIDALENSFRASNERIEAEIKKLNTNQLELTKEIRLAINRILPYQPLAKQNDAPLAGTTTYSTTTNSKSMMVVDIATLITQLVEFETVSMTELRNSLLPLGLMPNAVIDDINERALNMVGELALTEDGDIIIVQREVLLQVIAG